MKYIDEGGHCLNLLTQLNKYSSNLNQIAKAANTVWKYNQRRN
ncbi:plasmid mobilization relaxosome protein MobC [Vibrio harveyi]